MSHGEKWEQLNFGVSQAPEPHLGSRLHPNIIPNPIFLRESSLVVVILKNSVEKFPFFSLTAIQWNRKIPQHRHRLWSRRPGIIKGMIKGMVKGMIKGQPFPPHHFHFIRLSSKTPGIFPWISSNIPFLCHEEVLISQRTREQN